MKIYLNNSVITSDDQPLIIILSDYDKKLIKNMSPECDVFCVYEKENHSVKEIEKLCAKAKKHGYKLGENK